MKIRLGGMGQCFFTWLLYSQYSINQAERGRLVRCWQGLNNFMGKIWLKEESSHDHLGLYGRIDPLTLGGSCWLWFSSSRQCCSLRRQERYSSLRLSNSECSSLHCVGAGGGALRENTTKVIKTVLSGTELRWGRGPCVSCPVVHLEFLPPSSLPSFSQSFQFAF